MTFEVIEAKFGEVWKQIKNFVPMGSKEETERLKRRGLNIEKEQGEGSGTPTEPHYTPSPEADTSHPTTSSIPLPSIPT
nr:hypothetical protein [Tanacetum cinerariifolium]